MQPGKAQAKELSDTDSRAGRYFRHATSGHWDPYAIDIEQDRETLVDLGRRPFTQFRATVAMFGAGEEAVVDDLLPLATALEADDDQRFVASHLYEEAKHAAFFDRYWTDVINPVEETRGLEPTDPTADRWFPDAYVEILDRTETAMERLLEADTPEHRAAAYAHYHLTIEGVFAQVGFRAVRETFGSETDGPVLHGLTEGFEHIRRDEGRHVGFGLAKLEGLLASGAVDQERIEDVVTTLAPPVDAIAERMGWKRLPGPSSDDLAAEAADQRAKRLAQLTAEAASTATTNSTSRNGGR
ncbi:ribonucleoside-diphosphate reductase [Natronolimnohabitans sp. A-GB9]|uniref:ribonucleoside-diphosphate reductase n=1 Tax=Natronolimnohabitans sp. A-GB9 TaxID=3069757 RepID=UPI0027B43B77|nr:ribonucleoside-diphosphate reductase [Natronolimnohabitans sp. A-GB9]MDQ2049237.1 ribonucleoside-diphosphate reductase [Natronolimnohabitans sp. A-GB9]